MSYLAAKVVVAEKLRFFEIFPYFCSVIQDYLEVLEKHGITFTGLLLYGSVARRTARVACSDVDLIIIVQPDRGKGETQDLFQIRRAVARNRPSQIMAQWMTPHDLREYFLGRAGFVLDALFEGKILYDLRGEIAALRGELVQAIQQGKFHRQKGTWVWPLRYVGQEIQM